MRFSCVVPSGATHFFIMKGDITMSKAPLACPKCHSIGKWKKIDRTRKGFSAGKAVVGTMIAGPIGTVIGGGMGKKKAYYCCMKCGFEHEYDR